MNGGLGARYEYGADRTVFSEIEAGCRCSLDMFGGNVMTRRVSTDLQVVVICLFQCREARRERLSRVEHRFQRPSSRRSPCRDTAYLGYLNDGSGNAASRGSRARVR